MKPKISTIDGKTIVCLGDYNCAEWVAGKEKQALSILNAGCREARELLKQLGYGDSAIRELTKDLCGHPCPQVDPRFCSDPGFREFITSWKPLYVPYSRYNALPTKAKKLINELMRKGYVIKQICCVQYNEECRCVKTDHGFFIITNTIDYDKCIKYSRGECALTVRQAIAEVLAYIKSQPHASGNR